jgi:hypothetical protein
MKTTGVHLSPEPEVKSQSDQIKSVYLLGVVHWVSIFHFRFASFCFISFFMASFRLFQVRLANLLSERYFSFNSFGLHSSHDVYAGETTGSASSQIFHTGSLNAQSP